MRYALFLLVFSLLVAPLSAAPITYQGQLQQSGQPSNDPVNLDFRLFDAAAGGNQVGGVQERPNWPVSDGLFQVELDFGANAFDGSPRYLEIRINGAPLSPRQAVTATPQALIATTTVAGAIGSGQINAAQVQSRVTGSCPAGQHLQSINQDGTVLCGAEAPSWRLGGNAGTSSATDFLGTTDNQALELRTANIRSLRIEPSAELFEGLPITANIIAGSLANEVTPGVRGATIAGGGVPAVFGSDPDHLFEAPNRVSDNYGTVGGGYGNQAGDGDASTSNRAFATVGGGTSNTASGNSSTVGGGEENTASSTRSTVGGGFRNDATGFQSTVGGGRSNTASAQLSTVGGGDNNFASGDLSTVSGGSENTALGDFSIVGGGTSNTASGNSSTVGGGSSNTASGGTSTVGGGFFNCAGGRFSWAGGRGAKVRPGSSSGAAGTGCDGVTSSGTNGDEGTFVWADNSTVSPFVSSGSNRFLVRAVGGAVIAGPSAVTDPAGNRLRVDGTLRVDTLGTIGGSTLCRNSDNQLAACSSSQRYKQDIEPLAGSEALQLLNELRPVRYEWINNGRADIGLVAEEVAGILPEIVTHNEEGRIEGFEYSRLGPLLVAGFQHQTATHNNRFMALESEHARLDTENAELRAEVAVLKVQSGQMRELADRNAELERRLGAMEERGRENDDLRDRLAALETLLIEDRQLAERAQ